MSRHITIKEEKSGLRARFLLLDDVAPGHAEALWRVAMQGSLHDAIHAMWTGPEISCPIIGDALPQEIGSNLPLENATSFPDAGEIATVFLPKGTWKDMPPADFFDIGIFYAPGARLLMPMGWIMGSVCARVVAEDMQSLQAGCRAIRQSGACQLKIDTGFGA